jgi:hypothetical protein
MKEWNENRLLAYIVTAVFALAAGGMGSCAYNENRARTACIDKGGVPTSLAGGWICLAPLTGSVK